MALTPSTMLPLGSALPLDLLQKQLTPVCGGPLNPASLSGKPVLLLFLCPHCPFVHHIQPELGRLARDVGERVAILAINSNSERTHPQDGPDGMRRQAEAQGWSFPYLQDRDQVVARALQAACTPDPFLFDREHRLAYRGQFDSTRPSSGGPATGVDLANAVDALLEGRPVPEPQLPSLGCSIKWKPGNEPG